MIATALYCAVLCYAGAAALAATPFARPVGAPVRTVLGVLAAGVVLHAAAIIGAARASGQLPLAGLGPALSFAALALATAVLVVEYATREVTLTLVAVPLAAIATFAAAILGVGAGSPLPSGVRGAWLAAHIALSFAGIAAFGTAAAAGSMYLIERHQLRSRRFTSVFRLFPPLETLDRVNHIGAIAAWLGLSAGVALAVSYSATYGAADMPQIVWGVGAWAAATALALGRMLGGWRARRAAVIASVAFALILASYVAARVVAAKHGQFL
jgi:HemX protein